MKKKEYIVPAVEVHMISVQHMICNSIKGINGDTGVEPGEGDPIPPGGGESRRRDAWDDEEDDW